MVFSDISQEAELFVDQDSKRRPTTASTLDRLLSILLDVSIFSPIYGLLLYSQLKYLHIFLNQAPRSSEAGNVIFVILGYSALFTLVLQTLFIQKYNATPGQYFLKLRVVSTSGPSVTVGQAFLRSLGFVGSYFLLGIPFLGLLGDLKRQAVYEKMSDTRTVTMKKTERNEPNFLETRFMRNMAYSLGISFVLGGFLFFGRTFENSLNLKSQEKEFIAKGHLCDLETDSQKTKIPRVEYLLGLYQAGEIGRDCVEREADFIAWAPKHQDIASAYFVKAWMAKQDKLDASEYEKLTCELSAGLCHSLNLTSQDARGDHSHSLARLVYETKAAADDRDWSNFERFSRGIPVDENFQAFWVEMHFRKTYDAESKSMAQGIYEGAKAFTTKDRSLGMAAWLCHRELDFKCSGEVPSACSDISNAYMAREAAEASELQWPEKLAVIRTWACFSGQRLTLNQLNDLTDGDSIRMSLVKASVPGSGWGTEKRIQILKSLVDSSKASRFMIERISHALFSLARNVSELEQYKNYFEREKILSQPLLQQNYAIYVSRFKHEDRMPASIVPENSQPKETKKTSSWGN